MDIYENLRKGSKNQADLLAAIAAKRAGKKVDPRPPKDEADEYLSAGSARTESSGFDSANDSLSRDSFYSDGEDEVDSTTNKRGDGPSLAAKGRNLCGEDDKFLSPEAASQSGSAGDLVRAAGIQAQQHQQSVDDVTSRLAATPLLEDGSKAFSKESRLASKDKHTADHEVVDASERKKSDKPATKEPVTASTSKADALTESSSSGLTHVDQEELSGEDWNVGGSLFVPAEVASGLYPHQKEGIQWLWGLHQEKRGGILGDDMGLGKTRQIASFLAGLFSSGLASRALLVVPTTLLPQWHLEFASVNVKNCVGFSSSIPPAKRASFLSKFDGGVMLTTYEMTKDIKGSSLSWDYLVLDEGHLVKNSSTQRFRILKELVFDHCIMLTGTPIQNQLKELWTLYDLCCTGLLGDYKAFKKEYESPIVSGNEKDAPPRAKKLGNEASKALRERIAPYLLRRMKREIFPSRQNMKDRPREIIPGRPPPLPHKTDLVVWLSLTKRQSQVYEAFLQSDVVRNALNETKSPLAALTVLKKICDHPGMMTESSIDNIVEGFEESTLDQEEAQRIARGITNLFADERILKDPFASCKLKFLMTLLNHLVGAGHRVLIFSQTKWMLDKLEVMLAKRGTDFLRIDGDVKPEVRERRVQQFQAGTGGPVFLLTTKVGGVGLTLHSADRVVVLDPAWNPSVDNQSVDRAYRIGQQRDVVVYRLITCATVEEKIYGKQVMKDGLVRSATSNQQSQLRYFNESDVTDLFSMPPEGFSHCKTLGMLKELHDEELSDNQSEHVSFLKECSNVVGVSQHDLLYNKEDATILDVNDYNEESELRPVGQYPGPVTASGRKPLKSAQHHLNRSPAQPGILQVAKSGLPAAAAAAVAEPTAYDINRARETVRQAEKHILDINAEIEKRKMAMQKLNLTDDAHRKIQLKIAQLEQDRDNSAAHAEKMRMMYAGFAPSM